METTLKEVFKDYIKKLVKLVELNEDPFKKAYEYPVDAKIVDIRNKYNDLESGKETGDYYHIAGRVYSIRRHGKIIFIDIADETDRIQVVVKKDNVDEKTFKIVKEVITRGDIIGVYGNILKTKKGELSVLAKEVKVLTITFRPIPDTWFGLKDVDERYRQRYLDFIINKESRENILLVSKIEKYFRKFLDEKGFVEIHTPKLQPIYGGALARPFVTELWYTGEKVYLAIAPELYLKRLVVGQFYKVYEIATCFRNESIDATHNPEFVQIEIYWAFADWEKIMKLVEEMISFTVKEIYGDYKVEVREGLILNFKSPWRRIPMEEAIKKEIGLNVKNMSYEELREYAIRELGISDENTLARKGKIIEEIFEKYVQPKIKDPTFITLFRRDVSPLARPLRGNVEYVERFELYINGLEVGNGFSEQNNPFLQYEAFREEEELRKKVKKEGLEYMPMDKDYVRALEYGLPPTGGVGIGIYRLAMILRGLNSIKEVIPFPFVKLDIENILNIAEVFPEFIDYYLDKISKEELLEKIKKKIE